MAESRQKRFQRKRKEQGLCRRCGTVNTTSGINCTACRKKIKDQKKHRELSLKAAGKCPRCSGNVDRDGVQCTTCNKARCDKNLKLKCKVFDAYGGICKCCGDDFIGRLTIDHINNNGNKHRKELGSKGGGSFYHYLSLDFICGYIEKII